MQEGPVSACPVPEEQQPLNEYQELKESAFFRSAASDLPQYLKAIAWVWGLAWLVGGPVAAASFAPGKYPLRFFLSGAAGAGLILALALLRLYLGWSYVRDRLLQETIFYEESGWYDGQTWTKPPEILTRDRLIVSYQVQPILKRLKRTFRILILFVCGGSLIWNFL
jgi:hypothetical protein